MAFMPRTRPSVGCSAMVRTRPSPMCCSTSQMMSMGCGHVEALAGDADGGVDQGDLALGKLAVHGRSGHLHDFADALPLFIKPQTVRPWDSSIHILPSHSHLYSAAAAPLTTSMISLVMLAWRTRFMYSVSLSIMSPALEVAASMAVMRAACSAAADSSSAR